MVVNVLEGDPGPLRDNGVFKGVLVNPRTAVEWTDALERLAWQDDQRGIHDACEESRIGR